MIRPPSGIDSLLITHPANVRYLTGFTGSSGCVMITPRHRLFFTDFRYQEQAMRQVRGYSVRIVSGWLPEAALEHVRSRRMKLGVVGFEGACLSQRGYMSLRRKLKGVRLVDATGTVEKLRLVKSAGEKRRIRRAAELADQALARLSRRKVTGRSEKEVAWMLERWMREAGSGPMPFEIIVASGARSALPHGVATDKVIRGGELVVIDMGASVDGYCCDITRTFATGELTRRRLEIYGIVRKAQELALAAIRPGADCADADRAARGYITRAGYGNEFGHSLGHGVGLEPHEAPVLAPRSKDMFERGVVATVEPGIYLEGFGGVRIEDTVAVTARGPERLTKYPRELGYLK